VPRSASPTWPFVGREDDLRALAAALAEHGAVVVAGPAGVGKSRLARELIARAAPRDAVGIASATASSREIPLGVFAPWLGAGDDDGGVTGLARAARSLAAGGPRSVILVDDAHMLDAVSATLLQQVAQERALRLVLTVRTGEPCPDAVTALWKDGLAERVEIAALGPDATAGLLGAVLDAPVDAMALRRLHEVSRGNVLWLRHLVEGERAAGRLAKVRGRWQWQGDPALSPALEHLVDARIGTLAPGERRVLELLALGEPLGLGLLTDMTDEDDVERLAERGLIDISTDGARSEVRLGHPLYGEAVRGRLSLPRSRRLRGDLSRALRATGGRRAGDDLRRAILDLDSDTPPDSALLLLAAGQAMNLNDLHLAERLLRAAVDAGGGFDAQLALAFLLSYLMRLDETEAALAEAVDAAATPDERVRATLARVHVLYFMLDRGDEGRAMVDRVEAEIGADPGLESVRAVMEVAGGAFRAGARRSRAVLEDRESTPQAISWASWASSYAKAFTGGTGEEVRFVVARGMDAARAHPETTALLANLGYAEILDAALSGDPDAAAHRLRWVESLPGEHAATWSAFYRGRLALDEGRPRTAVRLLGSVLPAFPGHGGGWTAWTHAMIAQAHALTGDPAHAAASLEDVAQGRHPEIRIADAFVEIARAWTSAAGGAVHEALGILERAAGSARGTGASAVEVVARHTAVRLGDRGQSARLAQLAADLGTPRALAAAAHAEALAARDPVALLAVSRDLEAAHLVLDAADTAAQAATTAREASDLGLASIAGERAATLAARCEEPSTPALQAARAPLAVSSREREVAILAAEGLSNRQIAARLHVSVRTVESHVYRACTRLGLPDRAALAAAVAPHRKMP
jgi:DNA-binding NarL/FixJ family response regulator